MKVYCVQTFYGTKEKIFQHRHNAEKYHKQLCKTCECVDSIYTLDVSQEEFCYMDIED